MHTNFSPSRNEIRQKNADAGVRRGQYYVTLRLKLEISGVATPDDMIDRCTVSLTPTDADSEVSDISIYEVFYMPEDLERKPAQCDLIVSAAIETGSKRKLEAVVNGCRPVVEYKGPMGRVLEAKISHIAEKSF